MTSNPTIGPGALPNRKAGRLLFFYLRLNLLLLLHGRLRLRALQEHLLIVELSLGHLEISGPVVRHVVELLGHDEQVGPRARIICRARQCQALRRRGHYDPRDERGQAGKH